MTEKVRQWIEKISSDNCRSRLERMNRHSRLGKETFRLNMFFDVWDVSLERVKSHLETESLSSMSSGAFKILEVLKSMEVDRVDSIDVFRSEIEKIEDLAWMIPHSSGDLAPVEYLFSLLFNRILEGNLDEPESAGPFSWVFVIACVTLLEASHLSVTKDVVGYILATVLLMGVSALKDEGVRFDVIELLSRPSFSALNDNILKNASYSGKHDGINRIMLSVYVVLFMTKDYDNHHGMILQCLKKLSCGNVFRGTYTLDEIGYKDEMGLYDWWAKLMGLV